MTKIHQLSSHIVAKIKAGEVIERPAFAVKELIENSLDALADSITIEIEDSGLKKIVVTDTGEGMSREDLALCFKPHTTSKLQTEEELLSIKTLGFRGEALASIAAISTITIQSRTKNTPIGYEVTIQSGRVDEIKAVGMPVGTRIIIHNLFASIPGRKKFLKSKRTEFRHILDTVLHYALSFPSVRFLLKHDKRIVLDIAKNQTVHDRIPYIVGEYIFSQFVPVTYQDSYITISGFITKPHLTTSTQQKQFLFINKRTVSDKSVSTAVKESYGSMLDASSYPVFLLFITLPHEMVDINIHPRKEQVSFVNPTFIFEHVKEAITQTLTHNNLTFGNISWKKDFLETPGKTTTLAALLLKETVLSKESLVKNIQKKDLHQLHKLYIVVSTNNGFVIVDQHAAHERVLFEKLQKEFTKLKKKHAHTLQKPIPLTFSVSDATILKEQKKMLLKLGFTLKPVKDTSFILYTIPLLFKDRDYQKVLQEIIEDLRQNRLTTLDSQSHTMLAYLACHAAVKSGDSLEQSHMKELLEQLGKADNNYTCPHGRPTRIELTLEQLHKFFKR